jgi:hypothetical protein
MIIRYTLLPCCCDEFHIEKDIPHCVMHTSKITWLLLLILFFFTLVNFGVVDVREGQYLGFFRCSLEKANLDIFDV